MNVSGSPSLPSRRILIGKTGTGNAHPVARKGSKAARQASQGTMQAAGACVVAGTTRAG